MQSVQPKRRLAGDFVKESLKRNTNFWVVSPNVRNNNLTASSWKHANLNFEAAFMGYRPDDRGHMAIGYKFAEAIRAGDIVLIARRHNKKPDLIGFGVVKGKYKKRLRGFKAPESWHGSLRLLSPFESVATPLDGISRKSISSILKHTAALRKLHPERNQQHKLICDWMERSVGPKAGEKKHQETVTERESAQLLDHSHDGELEYQVRTKASVKRAKKKEAKLVRQYLKWLEERKRNVKVMSDGQLRCDVYEKDRNNLIEAKASPKREFIRMAVGQLLDYAYIGRARFGKPHMAILLPRKPDLKQLEWLPKQIRVVWKQGKIFDDNANKGFV
jgi:hypothetical protein